MTAQALHLLSRLLWHVGDAAREICHLCYRLAGRLDGHAVAPKKGRG